MGVKDGVASDQHGIAIIAMNAKIAIIEKAVIRHLCVADTVFDFPRLSRCYGLLFSIVAILAFRQSWQFHGLTAECLSGDAPQALGWFNAVNADVALMRRAFVTYPGDAESRATETAIDADNRALPQRNWYPYNTCADVRDVCGP